MPFNGAPCGAQVTPTPGRFTLASNVDDLLFALDGLSTPGQPPVERKAGICQGGPCEQNKHRFVLDASIKSVHILGQATVAGLDAQLVLPNGAVVPLSVKAVGQNTALTQEGVNISYSWQSEKTVAIDLTNPAGAAPWTGAWGARLPLAVHNHWAVLHDPTGAEDAAVLLLLVGGEASAEKRQDIVDDVNRRLPGLLSRLRADAASAGLVPPAGSGAPGPASPFDGGGAGPAGPSPFDFAGGGPQFPPAGGGQYQQQAPPPQQPQQYPPRPQQGPQQQYPPQQGPGPQPGFGYRDPRQPGGF